MSATDVGEPPYEPHQILSAPFHERAEMACRTFAAQSPNSPAVMALYWIKYFVVFIGGWACWNLFNANHPGILSPTEWAFTGTAFKKALVWASFYELIGFGCGWGPMNARVDPWFSASRDWLRTGTTKLPLFHGAPLIGGNTRNFLDVGVYAAVLLTLLYALFQPEVTASMLFPVIILIPIMGVLDKTLILAARFEHYTVALICLTFAPGDDLWVSACKMVWSFIWFWAAVSKVNHHFPGVIMVMMNNGPFFPKFLKNGLFQSYPDDLRPSTFAKTMAHFGSVTEFAIPIILYLATGDLMLSVIGLCIMTSFHGFIALNNPNGMPIEWNILMIYGGWFLFGFGTAPDMSVFAVWENLPLALFLCLSLIVVPTLGNFMPRYVSFLPSMRYYAGNWAYNVWLLRKDSNAAAKFDKLKKSSTTVREQFRDVMPDDEAVEVACAMMMSSRFMHLQGRPLLEALPQAVDDIENYDWYEGELVGGMIVGWNFGDGHLNGKHALRAIQPQCEFEPGECVVVSVESQPLLIPHWDWEIHDAASGKFAEGRTLVHPKLGETPWPTGEWVEKLRAGRYGQTS
jgi:hypothetical protein